MITFTVHTAEADDPDVAAAEIEAQLAEHRLLKNSVGIVSCFADFIGTGVLAAIAARVPFPIAGITTVASSAHNVMDELIFMMTVLSADDVEFAAAVTGPVTSEDPAILKKAWDACTAGRQDKPRLMLSFGPLSFNVPADFFAETWSGIAGNVPNFGTLAVDHNTDYHESHVILGGEAWRDRYVFILCYGNIEPEFFMGGIPEEKAFDEKGVVTSSKGNQLLGVNNVTAVEYLVSLGLEKDETGAIRGVNSYPFILDYNDGTEPVIRVMFAVTPEGSAICGGRIPEGATLTVGSLKTQDVLASTTEALRQAAARAKQTNKSMLIFSCIGRYFAQDYDTWAEMKIAAKTLGDIPYHMAYSGTEICPVHGKDGSLTNRSHNNTIVICVL